MSQKPTIHEILANRNFSLDKVKALAMHGLTDKELGWIIGVSEVTINKWKKHDEFKSALDAGKLVADMEVEKSLYKRATGFEYEETTSEGVQGEGGAITKKMVRKTKKFIAPDAVACIFWLKNRRPAEWRDRQEITMNGGIKILKDDV